MNKTTRILVITGAVVGAAGAVYLLVPAIQELADNLRRLRLVVEDVDDADEESGEMYRVGSIDITDDEIKRRIDEALKDHPEGWVTHE